MGKKTIGTWDFSGEMVDKVPPRIGPGQDRDPIYDPLNREAFAAAIKYLKDVEAHTDGKQAEKLSIGSLLNVCRSHGAIFDARLGQPDNYGEKLLLRVEDLDVRGEERTSGPRWFAPEHYAPLLLTTAPGGSIRHNYKTPKKTAEGNFTKRDKRRSHLSFGRGADGNIRMLRIVYDAPVGGQIHRLEARRDKETHREYRPRALVKLYDDSPNVKFPPAGYSTKGRKDAIELAAQHWQACLSSHRPLPNEMSAGQFRELLAWAWDISDKWYWR